MAYVTGSAADMAAVKTALVNACTANGWTEQTDAGGETVLSKSGIYIRVVSTTDGSGNGVLELLGRTSLDGGDAPNIVSIRPIGAEVVSFPVTYHAFVNASPDEVFFVINFSDVYHWCAFGQSQQNGFSGTGNWVAASAGNTNPSSGIYITSSHGGISSSYNDTTSAALFWADFYGKTCAANAFLHSDIDTSPWGLDVDDDYGNPVGITYLTELINAQPNQYSGEGVLLPIRSYKKRPDSKISQILELSYARYIRIDNYTVEQVITLGTDEWMVFPFYKKDATNRGGGRSITHTGTFGWAIKKA